MNEIKASKKVLLHSCCAICSAQPIKHLRELGYEPIVYFFNPNIYPLLEYQKRLDAQQRLCRELKCELIVEDYTPELYNEIMCGYENHVEGSARCKRCFELRLLKTVQKAKELGCKHYTTSISISPHKNFNLIVEIGKFFSEYYSVNFVDVNFRKNAGVLKTNRIADTLKLYRQSYCGCEMSQRRIFDSIEVPVV